MDESNYTSTTEILLIIGVIAIAPLFLILCAALRRTHDRNVELWAEENNLKILNMEITDREKTPFSWWTTKRSENFYRVEVLTETGARRSGFICVAGQMSAFFTPKARAIWDDEKQISQKYI